MNSRETGLWYKKKQRATARESERAKVLKNLLEAMAKRSEEQLDAAKTDIRKIVD